MELGKWKSVTLCPKNSTSAYSLLTYLQTNNIVINITILYIDDIKMEKLNQSTI